LGVVTDIARGFAFLPLGKLVKLGAAARAEIQVAGTSANTAARTTEATVARTAQAVTKPATTVAAAAARTPYGIELDRTAQPILDAMGTLFHEADPGGGICWAISIVRAIQNSGRYLMTLEDLARVVLGSAGRAADLETSMVRSVQTMAEYLSRLNVKAITVTGESIRASIRSLRVESQLEEAWKACSRMAGGGDGTIVFGIRWVLPDGTKAAHALWAKIIGGELRIFDRTGTVVTKLKDLEKFYPNIGAARVTADEIFVFVPNSRPVTWAAKALQATPFTSGAMLGPLAIPVKVIPSLLLGH
jgi:hypothetical protein